jgi:hypothetical protein
MPRPSYCNVGPQKTDKPHALTLYEIDELDNAISHERVYIPSPTGDGLERVRNVRVEERSGVPVAICGYGTSDRERFQRTAETAVSNLVVDPELPVH